MIKLLRAELRELYSFVRRNYSEITVVCIAALCFSLKQYHPISPPWLGSLTYYAIVPMAAIVILLRRNPLDFGFRLGNRRVWGLHVIIVFLVGLPVLYGASRIASVKDYYTLAQLDLFSYILETVVTLFAWEFILRGFLLFGLKDKLGELSILVQMVPFVLLHFGKPEIETLSTIIMGIYFGYVVYRGNSYWPALIIHLIVNISTRIFANLP